MATRTYTQKNSEQVIYWRGYYFVENNVIDKGLFILVIAFCGRD
jgi:hypothetical protein